MKTQRLLSHVLAPSAALVALATLLVVLGLAVAGPARAAVSPVPTPHATSPAQGLRDAVVQFGSPVDIGPNERVKTIISFGGPVTVAGTVQNTIVAFGGSVHLLPTAVVGSGQSQGDAALVLFGGHLTSDPGAQVTGQVKTFTNANFSGAGWLAGRGFRPLGWGLSFLGWLVFTAIFLILGLIAAALLPDQMKATQRRLAAHPWPSLGWGALTFFVVVPLAFLVLAITVVGLVLWLPGIPFMLLFYFFAVTTVAAFLAQKLLAGSSQRDNLMLAVTLGVVATSVVSRIPVLGTIAVFAMMLFGTGAVAQALMDWRRERKLAKAQAGPGAGPAGPAGPGAPGAPGGGLPGGQFGGVPGPSGTPAASAAAGGTAASTAVLATAAPSAIAEAPTALAAAAPAVPLEAPTAVDGATALDAAEAQTAVAGSETPAAFAADPPAVAGQAETASPAPPVAAGTPAAATVVTSVAQSAPPEPATAVSAPAAEPAVHTGSPAPPVATGGTPRAPEAPAAPAAPAVP